MINQPQKPRRVESKGDRPNEYQDGDKKAQHHAGSHHKNKKWGMGVFMRTPRASWGSASASSKFDIQSFSNGTKGDPTDSGST